MPKRIFLNGSDLLDGEPISKAVFLEKLSAMYSPQFCETDIESRFQQLLKYGYIQMHETESEIYILIPTGTYSMMTGGNRFEKAPYTP